MVAASVAITYPPSKLLSNFFQLRSGSINCRSVILKRVRHADDLFLGFLITFLFNSFADSGKRLGAVSGVIPGRINQVLVPLPPRQTGGAPEAPLPLDQPVVLRPHGPPPLL